MMNRREMLAGVGGVAAAAALNKLGGQVPNAEASPTLGLVPAGRAAEFPRKADFPHRRRIHVHQRRLHASHANRLGGRGEKGL
jgi:hypothetical protein